MASLPDSEREPCANGKWDKARDCLLITMPSSLSGGSCYMHLYDAKSGE
jgi:hypothetical protein